MALVMLLETMFVGGMQLAALWHWSLPLCIYSTLVFKFLIVSVIFKNYILFFNLASIQQIE